jgi:hypothetical protein
MFQKFLLESISQYLLYSCISSSVLKPGSVRRVDPGLEPGRVDEKTVQEFGPEKPGRPG